MIERICLNFHQYCNMSCPFCYIPFDKTDTYDFDNTLNVIKRISELGAHTITIGGGDPFAYSGLPDLVKNAKIAGLFTHVDTNILSMSKEKLRLALPYLDMIAIPFDGPPVMHDRLRARRGHFASVVSSAYDIQEAKEEFSFQLKINTMLCNTNKNSIPFLSELVNSFSADRWSIYQYWRLHNDAYRGQDFDLDNREYEDALSSAARLAPAAVEKNHIEARVNTYLFVSHNGAAYTHDPQDPNKYVGLGSIFEDLTIDQWHQFNRATLRDEARSRYRRSK